MRVEYYEKGETKVFNFTSLDDLILFTNSSFDYYILSVNLYNNFVELLNEKGIDINSDILDELNFDVPKLEINPNPQCLGLNFVKPLGS